ncbi:MAG: hypothetical protein IPF46_00580 [Saprospiraceae bacterium]|nr:hypothetical protein [Candidatus Vicinibacter affinis]
MPILQNIQSAYYYEDQDNTSDTTFSSNQRSLVIIQDSSGYYFLAVCNIIPNENYVIEGGINSNNNYRTKENSFDGVVFYTDWDDYILEGYKFTDGECSAIIDSIIHDSNDTVNILRPRLLIHVLSFKFARRFGFNVVLLLFGNYNQENFVNIFIVKIL